MRNASLVVVMLAGGISLFAAPLQAGTPAYGGVGASVASFYAANPNGVGEPSAGKTYYKVDATRNGRVISYHVVVRWTAKRQAQVLLARLTGSNLPRDATLVQPYNGYCAIYESRWLGRAVFALRSPSGGFRPGYVIVYVPEHQPQWSNAVNASTASDCRG